MNLAEQLFEAICALPEAEQLRLVERVIHELAGQVGLEPATSATVVGLWESDAAAVDEMVEGLMAERERRVLRSA